MKKELVKKITCIFNETEKELSKKGEDKQTILEIAFNEMTKVANVNTEVERVFLNITVIGEKILIFSPDNRFLGRICSGIIGPPTSRNFIYTYILAGVDEVGEKVLASVAEEFSSAIDHLKTKKAEIEKKIQAIKQARN